MEEMVKKLFELPFYERCMISLILTTDDEGARRHMKSYRDRATFGMRMVPEVEEACRAGLASATGKAREEFVTDLFASIGVHAEAV